MNNLRKLRKEKNLTLDEIAKVTNIKRGTFNNYENGKSSPTPETWNKLAKFFGVSVEYLQGAYSKEEIAEIVLESYSNYINKKLSQLALLTQPLTGGTIEDYLISLGTVPYKIKKEKYFLNDQETNNLDYWIKILDPLYKINIAMKWLTTKTNLNANKEDVLNAVSLGMNYLINISANGFYRSDQYIWNKLIETVSKNGFMHKRNEFLEKHKYWESEETLPNHWERSPKFDFEHEHELDGKEHDVDEIK